MKEGRESPSLHLDLSNFEDGASSRYVLTSPRSLEACARLRVRPIELLHKSLEEVSEENPEASGQQLNDLYVAQERERRHKLKLCRELRLELLQGDWQPNRASSHTPRGHKDRPFTSLDQQDPQTLSTDCRDPLDTLTRGYRDYSSLLFPDQHNPPPVTTNHQVPQDTSTRGHRRGSGTLQKSLSQGDLLLMEEKARRMARTVEREMWASVPDRDKKIGALMLLKHQEEEMSKQRRHQAQQAWDNLKTEERYIRAALDRQDWPIQMQNHRRRSWSSQLDWQVDPVHMSSHKTLLPEQRALLQYGLTKVMVDLKSKNPCYDSTSGYPLEERMIKAFKAKMVKDLQDKKNLQIKNEYEKLRHSKLKEKVDYQAKAEEHVKKDSIQRKEQRSKELQEKLMEERNKGLYEKASREDELKLMAKLRVMHLEKEKMEHKKMLAHLTDHKIQQARGTLQKSIVGKTERARELNFVKESTYQALKKNVDRQKENQRKEIVQIIRMKDQKSDRIRKEKEATVQEGKRIARASFHFRDKIRQQTKSRTFDQMALQATLNASLLKTIP
ncbi:PREDICTED: coiled-coil domain-containing protein 185 [Nanorana parkeri]|uniref:coiled-coil domain-containing protein 185 n=1 Tax=Nanorana parkeri TaxID=125878 RepID=UPI000854DE8C|nr:PREDICTED: coiled-coil domain-containing protein 185 [Nanorana parkeri]